MIEKLERQVELRAAMSEILFECSIKSTHSLTHPKPTDLAVYGATIYGVCAAVLVCLSNTALVWPFLAPGALGITIGLGLVAADQFSFRGKFERLYGKIRN